MIYSQTPEFQKELRNFAKKWRTLEDDLNVFEIVLQSLYVQQFTISVQLIRDAFFNNKKATILQTISDSKEVVKARLDCKALNNKDILRLTYIRDGDSILFVELYAKNDKQREDKRRIAKYS